MRAGGFTPILLLGVLASTPAWAVPTLSIDLDTGSPGIQSTRTTAVGDSIDIAVVLTGDGVTVFDTTIFDLAFNSGSAVIALAPGGAPTAGELADQAPLLALDAFGGIPIASGSPLIPHDPLATNSLGGIGMQSLGLVFPLVGSGVDTRVALMTFDALAAGPTALDLGTVTSPDFVLALNGVGLQVELQSASLIVRSGAAPEPGTLLIALAAALACVRRRHLVR